MNPVAHGWVVVGFLAAAVGLTSIGGVGCRTADHSTKPVEANPGAAALVGVPSATTPEACRTCDGVWGKQGIAQIEGCNCRARDAGRACRDGAACEGQCLLGDPPEKEVVAAEPPRIELALQHPAGYFIGHCSDRVTVFGCVRVLPRGFSSHGPVPLDAPPPMLCID
jgi:hypothetical protein